MGHVKPRPISTLTSHCVTSLDASSIFRMVCLRVRLHHAADIQGPWACCFVSVPHFLYLGGSVLVSLVFSSVELVGICCCVYKYVCASERYEEHLASGECATKAGKWSIVSCHLQHVPLHHCPWDLEASSVECQE